MRTLPALNLWSDNVMGVTSLTIWKALRHCYEAYVLGRLSYDEYLTLEDSILQVLRNTAQPQKTAFGLTDPKASEDSFEFYRLPRKVSIDQHIEK